MKPRRIIVTTWFMLPCLGWTARGFRSGLVIAAVDFSRECRVSRHISLILRLVVIFPSWNGLIVASFFLPGSRRNFGQIVFCVSFVGWEPTSLVWIGEWFETLNCSFWIFLILTDFLSFWKEIPLSSIVTSPRPLHSQLQNHLVKAERFQDNRASRASCDKPRWLRIFLPALLTKQNQEKIINKCNEFSSFARLSACLHSSFPKAESLSEQCIATLWSLRAQVQLYTHSSSSKCWLRKTYLGPKWHKMATQHVQSSPVMSSHQCIWSWRATHCGYYLDKFTSMTSMCQTCRINPRNMWSTRGEKGEEAVIEKPLYVLHVKGANCSGVKIISKLKLRGGVCLACVRFMCKAIWWALCSLFLLRYVFADPFCTSGLPRVSCRFTNSFKTSLVLQTP